MGANGNLILAVRTGRDTAMTPAASVVCSWTEDRTTVYKVQILVCLIQPFWLSDLIMVVSCIDPH